MADTIVVEVGYALPKQQYLQSIKVEQGATATMAIEQSGVLAEYPDIDLTKNKVGIFGKVISKAISMCCRREIGLRFIAHSIKTQINS